MTRAVLPGYDVVVAPRREEPTPLRTDIAGFAGRAARGPVGVAVPVRDFAEFTRVFGPPRAAGGHLSYALDGYFKNGGDLAYVVRVVGAGARAATGDLGTGQGQPIIPVQVCWPGAGGQDMSVVLAGRTGDAGRVTWRITVQPVGDVPEVTEGSGPTGLAQAAGQLRLVHFDLPEQLASGEITPTVGLHNTRLTDGRDGSPVGEDDYRAAVCPLLEQPEVALLAMPDLWDDLAAAALPFAGNVARQVHKTLDRMLLLDLPYSASASTAGAQAALKALAVVVKTPEARAVAVYHPWVQVADWSDNLDSRLVDVPPSGHVAGLISRLDRERGPSHTPANAALVDVVDIVGGRRPVKPLVLQEYRANPICSVAGRGLQVWGGRTFDPSVDGRFIAHRRLMHRLVRAARRAAEPLVFEPNGPALRLALTRAVSTVLLSAFRTGALVGRTASEAFSVQTQSDAEAHVVCEMRFAPADPMEFITIRLTLGPEGRLEVIEL